jgi:uncharacterized alkaline shock family protein YloU
MEPQDTITISPSVLLTIARHATLQVEGVIRMGQTPVDVGRFVSGNPVGPGIVLDIGNDTVRVELYVVTRPGYSMLEISRAVQTAVKRSITDLVGMEVTDVNVHIEDVADDDERPSTSR